MKKIIPNPDYDKATVSLGWLVHKAIGTAHSGAKFKTRPPPFTSQAKLDEWIAKNAISPTIEIDQ